MAKIGYVRVSTKEQNTARQEKIMEELGVDKLFVEKASGKNLEREQLKKMLEYVREGDTVIVESYSRFARSTQDLLNLTAELERKNVKFISQKESLDTRTAQGRLVLTIFAGLSQFEREVILERQREGIEIAKAEKRMGRPRKEVDFEKYYQLVQAKRLTVTEACKTLDIARSTWYSYIREHEKEHFSQEEVPTPEEQAEYGGKDKQDS